MKTIWGAVLLAMMLLTASALAADLDTPKVGAAVCAPEEENGSVVLHVAPDGRSESTTAATQPEVWMSSLPSMRE